MTIDHEETVKIVLSNPGHTIAKSVVDSDDRRATMARVISTTLFGNGFGIWDIDFHLPPERTDPTPASAPTPPPGIAGLYEQARTCQLLYRRWLDNDEDRVGSDLLLDDFLVAACDVLERLAGAPTPPSRLNVPVMHGTQELFDAGCRCSECRAVGVREC